MKKKLVILAAALVLMTAFAVGMTLAYLTSTTGTVTNTFTFGNVHITLDEEDLQNGGRTETGNVYHLIPGSSYVKDPVVHVAEGSENCWVFVKVENGISAIETSTIEAQILANGWLLLEGESNVYYKENIAGGTDLSVFETFAISEDAEVHLYEGATISITAYAVQSANVATAAEAWALVH